MNKLTSLNFDSEADVYVRSVVSGEKRLGMRSRSDSHVRTPQCIVVRSMRTEL